MTQQFATSDDAPPHNPHYSDAFVVFSVTVLSCAIGAWLLLRLGLALWVGSVAALGVYAALLSFHLMVRRSLVPGAAPAADAPVAPKRTGRAPVLSERPAPQPETGEDSDASRPRPSLPEPPARTEAAVAEKSARAPEELPMPRPGDPFNFRPSRDPSLSSLSRSGLAREPAPSLSLGEPRSGAQPSLLDPSQPEISVDFVEESIKKLADALNVATTSGRPGSPSERADDTDAMLGRSVEALQTTARAMRTRPGDAAAAPQPSDVGQVPAWWPTPEPASGPEAAPGAPPQLNPQLARIAEAVAAERMEFLLEPIHALVEGRPRHFEVSMRLLTAEGTPLDQSEYARAARGSGLMPRIDAAKMIRAARIAGRLGQRGREGSVLATVAGDSLTDQAFMETASAGPERISPMNLVLSFAQSEVRTFTPGHERALGDLAALGFRFALEDVVDLDMDFAGLKDMGFAFVELDAPVFLDGLPAPGGRVPASDICRHLADFGLSLIVGRIEDDWLLARILGFGVMFGKGTLFGGARLVKDEVVAGPAAA